MDQKLHSGNGVNVLVVVLAMVACATSVAAQQYCGDGCVAHAVQVAFAGCGDLPDNVSVHEGTPDGPLLPLVKAPGGYWEADKKSFEPLRLKLCTPDCSNGKGCASASETLAIERGPRRVCAARYLIVCNEQAWKIHVETEPGRWFLSYKAVKRTPDAGAKPRRGGGITPFDLCNLTPDEQVETVLQFQRINTVISIPLKPIHLGLFQLGDTVDVDRDEIVRALQTALGIRHPLSVKERESLPKLVTFKLMDR